MLITAQYAYAAGDVTGSGFGDDASNQCFYDANADCGGLPTWVADDGTRYLVYSAGYYRVTDTLVCPNDGSNTIYYYNNTADPTSGSWTVNVGPGPGGSFSNGGSCPSAPPTPPVAMTSFDEGTTTCVYIDASTTQCTTVKGTSTVDNPTSDLFLGFILFYLVSGGVIWFFRRR